MNTNTRTFALQLTEDELMALLDSLHAYKRSLVTDPRTRGIPGTEREHIESARAKVDAAFEQAYKQNRVSPGRGCCSCAEVTVSLNPKFGTLTGLETANKAATVVSWQLTGRRYGVPFKHADGRWYIRTSESRALVIPTPPGGDAAGHYYDAATNSWSPR